MGAFFSALGLAVLVNVVLMAVVPDLSRTTLVAVGIGSVLFVAGLEDVIRTALDRHAAAVLGITVREVRARRGRRQLDSRRT